MNNNQDINSFTAGLNHDIPDQQSLSIFTNYIYLYLYDEKMWMYLI